MYILIKKKERRGHCPPSPSLPPSLFITVDMICCDVHSHLGPYRHHFYYVLITNLQRIMPIVWKIYVFVTQNLENHNKLELRKSVIFLYFGAILQISKNVGSAKRKPGPRKKNIFLLKISPHFKRERERERDWFPKRPKLFDFSSFSGMASVDLNPVSWLTFFLCVIVSFFSLYSCICICMYICVYGEKYDFGG